MHRVWPVALLLITVLAGCLGAQEDVDRENDADEWFEGVEWNTDGGYSRALQEGPYDVLPAERHWVEAHDGVEISTAVWRPDVPEDQEVPVILDIGPYYGGSIDQLNEDAREDVFFLDNFVKNGYAYGRVSTRGTAETGGCMEFFGPNEQQDVDTVLTYYGEQDWSNGHLALYGASYDGTTPWIGAASGNEHLKTIVPVSGLSDVHGLMFRNGTAEGRGAIMHSQVYWMNYGAMPDYRSEEHRIESACDELVWGTYAGPWSTITGDHHDLPGPAEDYWEIRDWTGPVLDNYEGSVYMVHGMQDWNVEPSMAFPFMDAIEEKGLTVKYMLGQWGHDWPDRAARQESDNPTVANSVRWDWAELLLRWFDQELKGLDVETGPIVDIQDDQGAWRTEETWPPQDLDWTRLHLGDGTLSLDPTSSGSDLGFNPGRMDLGAADTQWDFETETLQEDLRVAGLTRLHVTVTPSSPIGGNLHAELRSVDENGDSSRVAHGVMNLRYHAGGNQPQSLTPGEPIVAKIELFAADFVAPEGSTLELRLWPDTGGEPRGSATPTPIELHWGDGQSVLKLPVIERDVGDGLYAGQQWIEPETASD